MSTSNRGSEPNWTKPLRHMHGDVQFWDEMVDVVAAATCVYHTQFAHFGYKTQLEAALSNLKFQVEQHEARF